MNYLIALSLIASTTAFGQYDFGHPIELTGTEEGARTVHFSDDGTTIYGDWDELTSWNLRDYSLTDSKVIPGYNTHASAFDGKTTWMNANVNYNSDKNDITDTHHNVNIISNDTVLAHKTTISYGLATFVPASTDVIIAATTKKYTTQVVRLSLDTFKQSTRYFDETKDGVSVPSSIQISPDGSLVAIGLAGETSGVRICSVADGSLVKFIPADADVNDVAFSQNGEFLFFSDGVQIIQLNTNNWTKKKVLEFTNPISHLDVNSTGQYVAFSFQTGGALFVDFTTNEVLKQLTGQKVSDVVFSHDDTYVAVGIHKILKSKEVPAIILYKAD